MVKRKIVGIVVLCAVVFAALLILMFTGIIPNIFLDRTDLLCERIYYETEDVSEKEFVEIYFDNLARSKSGKKISEISYNNQDLAEQSFEQIKKEMVLENGETVKLNNKIITIESALELELNEISKKKKEIIKTYEGYGYACK